MIKQRNIALCIVFSIITFGIYALYWFVCLTSMLIRNLDRQMQQAVG